MFILGIDPGPLPGVVLIALVDRRASRIIDAQALQVTPGVLVQVLDALALHDQTVVAMERFVVGPRAARSAHASASAITRDVIGEVGAWAVAHHTLTLRSAAEVKPWATDARLDAAGLLTLTAGMRHARDAARHALFCAVANHGVPDPLSRRTESHWGNGVGGGPAEHSGTKADCWAPECAS